MRFKNLRRFENLEENALLIFLSQRIDELTFDYSLDSNKAPTTNCPALIGEIYEILHQDDGFDHATLMARAKPIVDELIDRVSGNTIVHRIIPSERDIAGRLRNPEFHVLRETIGVLQQELSQSAYVTTCMELLSLEVKGGSKEKIDFLARELVASLENFGMSRAHIHFANQHEFYDNGPQIDGPEFIKKFFFEIYPHFHEFILCFKVKNFTTKISDDDFETFEMRVLNEVPEPFLGAECAEKFSKLKSNEKFFVINGVRAVDRFSAIETALRRISLVQNIFRVYHHKNDFGLSSEALVAQCCVEEVRLAKCDVVRMHNVADDRPEKAAQKLSYLLKNTRMLNGPDRSKLISVAEFHGMGLDTRSVENQILNIWIAMETLSPSRPGHTKIDDVLWAFLPGIGLRYFSRVVDQLLYDLIQWNRVVSKKILDKTSETESLSLRDKLFIVLSSADCEPLRQELYANLGNFELLRFRVFKLAKLFSAPRNIVDALNGHQRRVAWQLRRIYRVRNSIVHLGETPSFTVAVADNAHDYLDQIIHLTNDLSCGGNGFRTYAEMFAFLRAEFALYGSALKEAKDSNAVRETIFWRRNSVPSRDDVVLYPTRQV